jgi:hypothetical protein
MAGSLSLCARPLGVRGVLLLDADNVPVRDPTFLFESAPYRATGALFWPDYATKPGPAILWRALGIRRPAEPEFESGQILVDKRRCGKALALALWFNAHSDFFYRHIHGDKETFHLAFRRLRQSYAHSTSGARARVHDVPARPRREPALPTPQWRQMESPADNRRVPDFWHEEECRRAVVRLRGLWDGGMRVIAGIQPCRTITRRLRVPSGFPQCT